MISIFHSTLSFKHPYNCFSRRDYIKMISIFWLTFYDTMNLHDFNSISNTVGSFFYINCRTTLRFLKSASTSILRSVGFWTHIAPGFVEKTGIQENTSLPTPRFARVRDVKLWQIRAWFKGRRYWVTASEFSSAVRLIDQNRVGILTNAKERKKALFASAVDPYAWQPE